MGVYVAKCAYVVWVHLSAMNGTGLGFYVSHHTAQRFEAKEGTAPHPLHRSDAFHLDG